MHNSHFVLQNDNNTISSSSLPITVVYVPNSPSPIYSNNPSPPLSTVDNHSQSTHWCKKGQIR